MRKRWGLERNKQSKRRRIESEQVITNLAAKRGKKEVWMSYYKKKKDRSKENNCNNSHLSSKRMTW